MGVAEERAVPGQAIHVRRQRLRMAAQAPDPVVQVVYGDEEDIGLRRRVGSASLGGLPQKKGCEQSPGYELPYLCDRPAGPLVTPTGFGLRQSKTLPAGDHGLLTYDWFSAGAQG
jgi:hypothetical protein